MRKKMLISGIIILLAIIGAGFVFAMLTQQGIPTGEALRYTVVDKAAARSLISEGSALVIDVRTPAEFNQGHIETAVNMPLQELGSRLNSISDYKDKQVLVYCRTQNRSMRAAGTLSSGGFSHVFVLKGGYMNWVSPDAAEPPV